VWLATYGAGGRLIITDSGRGAQIWEAASGRVIRRLPGSREQGGAIRLSPDGARALTPATTRETPGCGVCRRAGAWPRCTATGAILTVDTGDDVTVRRPSDGRRIARLPHWTRVVDVDLSADGRLVVTAGRDGRAEVRDVASGGQVVMFPNGKPIASVQFDERGRSVVTGDDAGVARVWRLTSRRAVQVLRGHTAAVRRARFSPDGARVLTVSDDGSARLWPARPSGPSWRGADSMAFSPDSRRVLDVRELDDPRALLAAVAPAHEVAALDAFVLSWILL